MTQSTKLTKTVMLLPGSPVAVCLFYKSVSSRYLTLYAGRKLVIRVWGLLELELILCVFMILLWHARGIHCRLREQLRKLTTSRLKICCTKVDQENALRHELKIPVLVKSRSYTSRFQCSMGMSLHVISHFGGEKREPMVFWCCCASHTYIFLGWCEVSGL